MSDKVVRKAVQCHVGPEKPSDWLPDRAGIFAFGYDPMGLPALILKLYDDYFEICSGRDQLASFEWPDGFDVDKFVDTVTGNMADVSNLTQDMFDKLNAHNRKEEK